MAKATPQTISANDIINAAALAASTAVSASLAQIFATLGIVQVNAPAPMPPAPMPPAPMPPAPMPPASQTQTQTRKPRATSNGENGLECSASGDRPKLPTRLFRAFSSVVLIFPNGKEYQFDEDGEGRARLTKAQKAEIGANDGDVLHFAETHAGYFQVSVTRGSSIAPRAKAQTQTDDLNALFASPTQTADIGKKPRSEKQLANDRRLAQAARERNTARNVETARETLAQRIPQTSAARVNATDTAARLMASNATPRAPRPAGYSIP